MKNLFTSVFSGSSGARAAPEMKSSRPLIALELASRASWTPRQYGALSREGFQRNPVAYRCVRLVADAAASVRLCVRSEGGQGQAEKCLGAGNPDHSMSDVMESFYSYLQLSGNAFLELGLVGGQPAAIFALRPDRVEIKPSSEGHRVYTHDTDRGHRTFMRDAASGRCALHHMRLFHPASDTLGFSPLEAAAQAVDIHNEGGRWTKALLDNSARPSGALIYKNSEPGHYLPEEQFDRIKSELEGAYAGARHAGRPMVLEGGLDWKSMSLSPADMDFLEARREAAREIALALGVPPMLLGIPGDNTYANYKEANLALWRQTVMPMVTKTARGLENWLRPWFGDDLSIEPDFDAVPALSQERAALWARLEGASFLSQDERRALAGLPAQDDLS